MAVESSGIGSSRARPHAHAGAATGIVPVPAPELWPGVASRRRGRGSRGVAAWIRAHACARDAAALKQEEGERGSGAHGSCDPAWGDGGAARRRSVAAWVWWVRRYHGRRRGAGGTSGCEMSGRGHPSIQTSGMYHYRICIIIVFAWACT